MFQCNKCNYFTERKYNLQRHSSSKHGESQEELPIVEKVTHIVEIPTPVGENVTPGFYCCKCNKKYNSTRYLVNHEKNCKKVDSLTCPKCMVSFSNRHHKSRHIKANTCEARSIIHSRTHSTQNIYGNVTIENQSINNINNIIINNIGSERIDHITYDEIKKILQSGENTIPLYIEKKHFDKNFPENNNIKYTDDNKCKVLENNSWREKDLGTLSTKLIKENSEVLLLYCDENDVKLSEDICDADKYDHIKNKLILIYNKSDNTKYVQVLNKIKDLIKQTKEE